MDEAEVDFFATEVGGAGETSLRCEEDFEVDLEDVERMFEAEAKRLLPEGKMDEDAAAFKTESVDSARRLPNNDEINDRRFLLAVGVRMAWFWVGVSVTVGVSNT